jgi:hypothetical protein
MHVSVTWKSVNELVVTCATLFTGCFSGFVVSTAAPIASTGWSDPVPGRVCLPAVDQRLFHGAL